MNLSIQPITVKYFEQTLQLHTDVFFKEEPLTPKLDISVKDFKKIIGKQILASINKEYALGAFDSNKLVGFIICSQHENNELEISKEDRAPFEKLDKAVERLDLILNKDPYDGNKLFHIETMGIDRTYIGHGIGKKLIKQAVELAKKYNFKYIYAECTNIYSEKGMLHNGFEIIHKYPWKDSHIEEFKTIPGNFSLVVKQIL